MVHAIHRHRILDGGAKTRFFIVEPTAPAMTYPFYSKRLIAVRAARAPAGLERGGDRSAGPAGGWAARGERSEPP